MAEDIDTIELDSPLDMHVHFRQGVMMNKVVPLTARDFAGALVMPNLDPPLWHYKDIIDYQQAIEEAAKPHVFKPYMTAYLNTEMDADYLRSVKPHILAVKLYPKGMTTNSDHGVNPLDPKVLRVLAALEEVGVPLCVHGEAEGFCMDREWLFAPIYSEWARTFPRLKVIMEHISDRRSLQLLVQHSNLYATITPQHFLWTLDAVVGGMLNPHAFWKPILKTPPDRDALQHAALGMNGLSGIFDKLMLGTDSAPHPVSKKECDCGCAGVFNATVALKVLAPYFVKNSTIERFMAFVSANARRIYGINPPIKKVVLIKRQNVVPKFYENASKEAVVPMMAGQTLEWDIAA